MGEKLLTSACTFQCSCLVTLKAKTPLGVSARDQKNPFLTEDTKLQPQVPGSPCPIEMEKSAGAALVPCRPDLRDWRKLAGGISYTSAFLGRKSLLTDRSSVWCTSGGIIRVQESSVHSITSLNDSITASGEERGMSNGSSTGPGAVAEAAAADTADKPKETALEEPDPAQALYASCNYRDCKQRDTCPYFKAGTAVDNNSQQLRTHFQSEREKDWDEYEKFHREQNGLSTEGNWRIAAHHIISGNQVLLAESGDPEAPLRYGILVKLCNYFGYDVNCAENCIMLPTNEQGFGNKEEILKTANAYTAMSMMGRQWHVGGHAYTLSKDTQQQLAAYYQKHPASFPAAASSVFFNNYRSAMLQELDQLLKKYERPRCWKRTFVRRRGEFFSDMNGVSRRVERYLLQFQKDPRNSFPFYVSKAAVEYAFDIPRSVKLAIVYRGKDGALWAKKLRVERLLRTNRHCAVKDQGGMRLDESRRNALEFINFCGNIFQFLVETGIGYQLPFTSEKLGGHSVREVNLQGRDVMVFLQDAANELFAYGQERSGYCSPAQTAAARRKEFL